MALTTTPPATPSATLPWAGLFDTPEEVDAAVTDVDGRVPEGLAGTLYRNGPGKLSLAQHLFDGDGMVSAVRFAPDGSLHFRNRFVRTRKYVAELRAARATVSGFGTLAAGGPLRNALRRPTADNNAANTSLVFSAGRLLALWEAGHPWEIDPTTLETIGEMDFDGALEARLPFSAHPHWDPETREIFNFGMVYGPRNAVATYRIDRSGRLHRLATTRIPASVFNHDFILTSRYLVFCLNPVRARLARLLAGFAAFGDSLRYHPEEPTTVVLVPRDGGEVVQLETESWFQYHFAGAFDDGDDVVVDLVRYPGYDGIATELKGFRSAQFPTSAAGTLWRLRVSPSHRRCEAHQVAPQAMEFPQVDGRRATGGYRVVYAAFVGAHGGLPSAIGRVDTTTGATDQWDFGPGRVVTEPLFVPRPGGHDEDDGWLLALVYDPDRTASDAVVLDARHPGRGPVCTAHLPVNTGMSFHGTWRPAGA